MEGTLDEFLHILDVFEMSPLVNLDYWLQGNKTADAELSVNFLDSFESTLKHMRVEYLDHLIDPLDTIPRAVEQLRKKGKLGASSRVFGLDEFVVAPEHVIPEEVQEVLKYAESSV